MCVCSSLSRKVHVGSTFKYFIIILTVCTCYIIVHKLDNKIFIC